MSIVLLSGLPGSGKSTLARALAQPGTLTEIVDAAAALSSWLPNAVDRSKVGPEFLERYGVSAVPVALLEHLQASHAHVKIVDAVRTRTPKHF